MLFEMRTEVPDVSAAWIDVRDDFLIGRARTAWDAATKLRGSKLLAIANDYILNMEIARACSANATYMSLGRLAKQRFPDDPIVQLYHARIQLTRGRHMEGIRYLEGLESTLGKTHRSLWATELANIYAGAGFELSCRRWMQELRHEKGMDTPLALYTQACAQEGNRKWDKAIDLARSCVEAAPNWSRARGYYANCLLSRGRVDEALAEFEEVVRRGHQEHFVELSQAMVRFAVGDLQEARTLLQQVIIDWPMTEYRDWVRRALCILLVELEECDAAIEIAAGDEQKLMLPELPRQVTQAHRFIPLPLVAQNKNQCVPTTVAMAAYPQGGRFDPAQLFAEMHGREGTAIWRMREWVQSHGYRLISVKLDFDSILKILDFGIPLIGVLEGIFNSHVDVVCGYNRDLQVLYVRDPVSWLPLAYPFDIAVERYALHQGLLAVIAESNTEAIAVAESCMSNDCTALIDLAFHIAAGNFDAAQQAADLITDQSPTAFLRDGHSRNVLISPTAYAERVQKIAENPEANRVARFRALMQTPDEAVGEILENLAVEEEQTRFVYFVQRYIGLMTDMKTGNWIQAKKRLDRLLLTGCSVGFLWDTLSDVYFELGQHEKSHAALDRAIELEPKRLSYREKLLARSAETLTLAEYVEEFERLIQEDPEDRTLLWGRALALQDGPDGRAYEEAMREHIRWYPRDPSGYLSLLSWYSGQNRGDLVDKLLEEGKAMLPDVFGKKEGLEESGKDSESKGTELPKEASSLLPILKDVDHPQREAAIEALNQMATDGLLKWYERAEYIGLRLVLRDADWVDDRANTKRLLPPRILGSPVWFANSLINAMLEYRFAIRTASDVDDWLRKIVPNFRDHVELWFNRILLLEEQRQMEVALSDLTELLERYPRYSSALYRMGTVKHQQEDFPECQNFMQRALDVNPGLYGAMYILRTVHQQMDEPQQALKYTRMLRRKVPYQFDFFRDEVLHLAEHESLEVVTKLLKSAHDDYEKDRVRILGATVYLGEERIKDAEEILDKLNLPHDTQDDELYEDYLQTRINIASRKVGSYSLLHWADEGLRRWPKSTRLLELKAGELAEETPQEARRLLKDAILQAEPTASTAWQYLTVCHNDPDVAARRLVEKADENRKAELADLFAQVLEEPSLLSWFIPFAEWVVKNVANSDSVRWRLTSQLTLIGRSRDAVSHARKLLKSNPDSVEAKRTLGRCLIDFKPKEGLEYLKEVCETNRSTDFLFDLARCYLVVGDRRKSMELHWEILQHNPFMAASWTNLFIEKESHHKLWPFVGPMLKNSIGADDEYFLVAVVMGAVKMGCEVPSAWIDLAARRYEALKTYRGFRDEKSRLTKCMIAWLSVRPSDRARFDGLPTGILPAVTTRFSWPGRKWIPKG